MSWNTTEGDDAYKTLTIEIKALPEKFTSGTMVITAPGISSSLSKTFTLRTINSDKDYDLLVPHVINTSAEYNLQVKVRKKTRDNITTLQAKNDDTSIKLTIDNAEKWTATVAAGSTTPIKVKLTSTDGTITWDEEIIEVVNDGFTISLSN